MAELYLDSQEARKRVVLGDADTPLNNRILPTGSANFTAPEGVQIAQAAPQGRRLLSASDVGYVSPFDGATRAPTGVQGGFLSAEQVGFVSPFARQNEPIEPPVQPKPESEGFATGLGKSLLGGIQDTAGSLYAAGATILGANNAVVESSQAARERQKTEAKALGEFKQDIGRRQEADDSGLFSGIKNVAGAVYDNPEGAFQMLVSQIPNSAAALGLGAAGAAAGSVIPGVGTVVGGIGGFLTGLFTANTALEIGGKAQEKARDNVFTNQERSEAIGEGATKGAVITGVDAVTLGASKWLLGTANRAVETATMRSLQEAGIDTTKAVASIKEAQRAALEATASQGRVVSTAAIEKATYETMVREGLTDPAVMTAVRNAQKTAMDSVNTLGKKAARGTSAVGLETVGEGLGEYLGELAATGKASPTDAVLEALSGLSLSLGELNAVSRIQKPGTLTAATNISPPELKTQDTTKSGAPIVDALTENVTRLDDFTALASKDYFERALKNDREATLDVMAAIYHQEKIADPTGTPAKNPMLRALDDAMTRLSVTGEVLSKAGGLQADKPTPSVLNGEQILSDNSGFRSQFVSYLEKLAGTLPANTTPKKDNRVSATPDFKPLSEEDVMNAPIPDDNQETGKVVNPEFVAKLDTVKSAENPGVTSAQFIKESLSKVNSEELQNWDQTNPDQFGVTTYTSPENKQQVFTHPKFPGYVFDNKDNLFNAFKLNKQATQALRDKIALKANPPIKEAPSEDIPDIDPDLLYSKTPEGRVKAAFFKDLKKVYYSNFAWQVGKGKGQNTRQQFRALEMHEVGAHYAIERMVGSEEYQRLLGEMRKLKGKDKMITEAYNSVPSDTIPSLVDHEALGYLVENYENSSFVQRLLQMFKDWYAKAFNNQALTSTDLRSMVNAAFQIYSKEVTRVYLKENITATPKAGTKRVNFQGALNETPDAHKFLDFMEQFKDKVTLSGSLAIAAQKPIFRPSGVLVHDLDFRLQSKEDLSAIMEAIAKEYPNSGISNQFVSKVTSSDTVSIALDKDNPKSLTVDFFIPINKSKTIDKIKDVEKRSLSKNLLANLSRFEDLSPPVEQTYTGADGKERTVRLSAASDIFGKKMAMNRAKDVNDAIQGDIFDVAFSKEKPTVTDLIKVLPSVIKRLIEEGGSNQFNDMRDLTILLKNRMNTKKDWSSLSNKLTEPIVRQAYQNATNEIASTSENERKGTFVKDRVITKEELKDIQGKKNKEAVAERDRVNKANKAMEEKRQTTPVNELKVRDLETQIKNIYKQYTQSSFLQDAVNTVLRRISDIEATLLKMGSFAEFGKSGELNIYKRITDGQVGMEQQILNDGRMSGASDYYNREDEAVFENPDTRAALLAKKRILEKELELAMRDKVSKQAYLGRIGLREIRRQIDDAIQQAVRDGLPIEDTIELGRQWLGGIDNYFNLSSIQKAERKAQNKEAAKEIEQYFQDLKNTNVEEVSLPSDIEFANGIHKDLVSRKITTDEAVKLVDQAAERGELESKKKTVTALLSQLVSDFGIMKDTSAAEKALTNITNWASKLKKEGLLRYDDLVDIFHSNNVDTPHAVVKMSEVAASRGLLDFMAENKHDSTFRYYWLRSMDRVVNFNPDTLNSYQFTDLERDLYAEYKKQIGSINNRRKNAYEKQEFDDLLFNRYTVDQMRNPESLPLNERMRLQQMYPSLVDAYFSDILFANRNGYGRDAADKLNEQDRGQFQEWLDRKNKMDDDSSARLERQQYFAALSQFRHISDEDFTNLYKMMSRDSIANLPMILDMARELNNDVLESDKRGEINTTPQTPRVPMTQADVDELNNDAFEQDVMSAFVNAQMGVKGVASSSLGRDPLFDFNTYKDAVEGRLVSYEESSGEQNAPGMEDESVAEQMMYGMDVDMQDLTSDKNDASFGDQVDDETRLRQGQYTGILSTGLVMNYVSKLTKTWKNAPNIVVLQSHLQLPEGIREEVAAKLQNGMGAKGLFDGSTGTVYLFSNFLDSEADVQFTLFHEAYGHLGLRLMFGQEFDTFLNNMYESSPAVRADVDARMRQGGVGRLEAIEETLSDYAGQNKEVGAVKQFIGKIIEMLRKIGLNKVANFIGEFTDAELAVTLKLARQYAENAGGISPLNGAPKDIRLSDDRPPYELFAKKGVNTVGYARYDPLIGQYYLYTATKGDIRTGSTMTMVDTLDDVIAALDKLGTVERRKRSGFFRDNKVPADFVKFLNSQQLGLFASKWETFLRGTQNQYLPVFRLVEQMEQLGRVSKQFDLRVFLRTTERQTAEEVNDFNKEYVTPIMDLLAQAEKAGGSFMQQQKATNIYEMLNKFLLAQHADERNKQVNKRYPQVFNGAGMASASSVAADPIKHPVNVAQQIMDFVAAQPYAKEFSEIGRMLDRLGDAKVDREVAAGLLTADYYNAQGVLVAGEGTLRKAAYRNYRNFGGVNNQLDEDYTNDPSLIIGRKFNMRGKDKAALGRADEAPDILARTLLAAEASIIRSNKNNVAQRVLAFFETNYDPNFVSINEQSFKRQIDPNGFVELVENTSYYNQPDVFVAKVRGIPVTIRFKDAGYNSIAEAIHGKSDPQSEHPVRHIMQLLGRTTGALITKYNPFWIPVNFVRDVQTLFLNAGVNKNYGWKMAGEMGKALLPAMGTSLRVALMDMNVTTPAGKAAKAMLINMMGKPNAEMLAHYQEGRKAGAFTSFINHRNLEDQIIEINEAINGKSAISKIGGLFKFWELVTLPVEMAPRLAAYSTLKNNGSSTLDAADYAGSVTVDFNMRGANEWLRAAYLFFNPAVQGTAQLVKLAKENPKRFGLVAGGLMSLGFLTSMMGRLQGDDDDEKRRRKESGLSVLDEMPEYKRSTSVILFPNTRGGAIPIAYGWNAFFAAGVFAADSIVGNVPVSLSIKRTFQATFEAFSPVGGSGFDITKLASDPATQALSLFMPTAGAPLSQWQTNKNRWGGPLYPDSQFSGQVGMSDVTKAFDSVNPISRWVAENLQSATGGNRFNKQGIDINPALIDHVSQSYLPGLISEIYKGAGVAVRKAQGIEMAREKEPLFDRFSAYPSESFDSAAFRRVADAVNGVYGELDKTPSSNPRRAQIMEAHPEIGLMKTIVTVAGQEMRTARADIREAQEMAYILRQNGQIERANKMDADAVELRNKTKKYEKELLNKVVTQAAKSGFSREVYSD